MNIIMFDNKRNNPVVVSSLLSENNNHNDNTNIKKNNPPSTNNKILVVEYQKDNDLDNNHLPNNNNNNNYHNQQVGLIWILYGFMTGACMELLLRCFEHYYYHHYYSVHHDDDNNDNDNNKNDTPLQPSCWWFFSLWCLYYGMVYLGALSMVCLTLRKHSSSRAVEAKGAARGAEDTTTTTKNKNVDKNNAKWMESSWTITRHDIKVGVSLFLFGIFNGQCMERIVVEYYLGIGIGNHGGDEDDADDDSVINGTTTATASTTTTTTSPMLVENMIWNLVLLFGMILFYILLEYNHNDDNDDASENENENNKNKNSSNRNNNKTGYLITRRHSNQCDDDDNSSITYDCDNDDSMNYKLLQWEEDAGDEDVSILIVV